MDWLPDDPALAAELTRLHAAARAASAETRARGGFKPDEDVDDIVRLGSEYLALSPEEGQLIYMLARSAGARRVVEFGASFGISTLYFAAAMRATGGRLITTEVHPDKCRALRETLARAGVADCVDLLEGDARETLKGVEGPVDMVLLDGWKSMYLPVLTLLRPRLARTLRASPASRSAPCPKRRPSPSLGSLPRRSGVSSRTTPGRPGTPRRRR